MNYHWAKQIKFVANQTPPQSIGMQSKNRAVETNTLQPQNSLVIKRYIA